ncbi:MAG: glycosidase [Candidatus Nomurabacteria bacterium]|nr:glycosidase [Candidatus Nomurabacteria bacterium]
MKISKNKIIKEPSLKNKSKIVDIIPVKIKKSKGIVEKIKKVLTFKKIKSTKKILKIKIIPKANKVLKEKNIKLKKVQHNPIIEPSLYSWESKATFNPTAFEYDGKVHIIYRAVGEDDSSVLGYAFSNDGLNIEGRPTYHIYKRFFNYTESGPKIDYLSGGGWSGGCEDPRVVLIEDTIYMIFTAFDGWGSVRLALTSISLSNFKKKKWNWKKAVMISPVGEINKNWVLFPERINGKFAIIHSVYPNILISCFDSLDELDGKTFIKSNNTRPIDHSRGWDSWFRGIGPSPIKTKDGWLILYHAMDHKNPDRYRLGALLLDLNDPTKVIYRSKNPILEPEEDYENNGHKWGVIYSCGAVVKNGELFVYYGGADKFVCVASINLKELIDDLKKDVDIKLVKSKKK